MIQALLGGRDVLALLPTGAGKSLTYQFTVQLLPGVMIVVSPLIALMHDQMQALEQRGIPVAVINSTRSRRETLAEFEWVRRGDVKLLYVTPERFTNAAFMQALCQLDTSLFVVNEAHCISE